MTRRRLVLASANPDKVAEMAEILGQHFELSPRPSDVPEIEEVAETLEDNARLKAEAICMATGEPAIADDTGLEVSALNGGPGVRSARYAPDSARAYFYAYSATVPELPTELSPIVTND